MVASFFSTHIYFYRLRREREARDRERERARVGRLRPRLFDLERARFGAFLDLLFEGARFFVVFFLLTLLRRRFFVGAAGLGNSGVSIFVADIAVGSGVSLAGASPDLAA